MKKKWKRQMYIKENHEKKLANKIQFDDSINFTSNHSVKMMLRWPCKIQNIQQKKR